MNEILLTQVIDAPVERVWRACADASGLAAWQADEARGRILRGESVTLSWPRLSVELELEVMDVLEHRRLRFAAGGSELELEFEPGKVVLRHSGVGDGDELEGVTSSWRMSLAILAHYCERHAPRRRTVRWLVRPARTSAEAAHVFFTDAAALGVWLGKSDGIGEPGERYAIDLAPDEAMSGVVLANTKGRDVAFSWDEDGGSVLCLRTLPRPLVPGERWLALSWSRWSDRVPAEKTLQRLDAAHHRLVRAFGSESQA